MPQVLELQTPIALEDERGSGRLSEWDRANAELLSVLELQAQALAPATYHWYATVEHPVFGEQGFYVDTVSDRFSEVMEAVKIRRQELKLFGYKCFEVIDLGTLPF